VAGYEEIRADPGILTEAVAEGRGSRPFFQCSGTGDTRAGLQAIRNIDTFRSPKASKHRLIINLRRGESITRRWDNEGQTPYGARHHCQPKTDVNDPVNWPYWEPYAELRKGIKRSFGNGRLVCEPDLARAAFLAVVAKDGARGLQGCGPDGRGPRVRPAKADSPGSLEWVIDSPYVAMDAWLDLDAVRKTDADRLTVHARGTVGRWRKVWNADATGQIRGKRISLKPFARSSHRFFLRFEMKAAGETADVGIDAFKVTTVFMNNKYALPYFLPGRNVVRVIAAKGADPKAHKITLEYAWEEEGQTRKLARRIEALPFEVVVNVAGKKHPRMRYVRMAVAP
jgi:hypothetical protein